jgi:hypothetical protein
LILASVDGQLVNRALDRLSVRHRHVLAMREGSGWTYQQMADHEGVEIGTIETLLWRARQALKREFNVLSESKGALAGFLVAAGALVRRGVLRVGHKASLVQSGGSSGGIRNLFTGVAVTGAAVAAAFVVPHALTALPAPPASSAGAQSAAALANPALPLLAADNPTVQHVHNDSPSGSSTSTTPGGSTLASGTAGGPTTVHASAVNGTSPVTIPATSVTIPPATNATGPVVTSAGQSVSSAAGAVTNAADGLIHSPTVTNLLNSIVPGVATISSGASSVVGKAPAAGAVGTSAQTIVKKLLGQ